MTKRLNRCLIYSLRNGQKIYLENTHMMHIYVCMALTFKEIQNLTITNSTDSPTTTITVNFFVTDFFDNFSTSRSHIWTVSKIFWIKHRHFVLLMKSLQRLLCKVHIVNSWIKRVCFKISELPRLPSNGLSSKKVSMLHWCHISPPACVQACKNVHCSKPLQNLKPWLPL